MNPLLKVSLILSLPLLIFTSPAAEQLSAESFRMEVLRRLQRIQSIECEYYYYYNKSYDIPFSEKVTLKSKGEWVSHRRERSPADVKRIQGLDTSVAESNVHGTIDRLFINEKVRFQSNARAFALMAYNQLSPLSIIGKSSAFSFYSYTDTLIQLLQSPGLALLERSEEVTVLYVFPDPAGGKYDVHFPLRGAVVYVDDQWFIRRIDYVSRPLCSMEDIVSFAPNKDPKHLYQLIATNYFEKPVNVDGFLFPTRAVLVVWT